MVRAHYKWGLGERKFMKRRKIWNIPRSDQRDRCGECLLLFGKKKRNVKFSCKKHKGYRFPKVCYGCKLLLEK